VYTFVQLACRPTYNILYTSDDVSLDVGEAAYK